MLSSQDVHRIAGQLRSVDQESRQHHENLGSLLRDFQSLLRSYHALKNDYAEEKEAHGKHKKISRDYERNPFVLVLVDGDNYLFHEHLIKDRSEGGITAARLLTDGIKDVLHDRLGDQAVQCRVVIRIYANLLGLSKALARAGLAGNEARSFAGFASSFTRSQDLADYTDAGDKKEAADHKIRELFRLFIDINQCKHIFFAGCHDTGYLSLLTPYRGMADRITLLKAASFHKDFTSLGLSIAELPSVFMSTSIANGVAASSASKPAVCWFFQKGICKHGSECIKQHVMPQQQITIPQTADTQPQSSSISSSEPKRYYLGGVSVPMNKPMPENCIAVNQDGDHLDVHIPQPSNKEWTMYTQHTKKHKPCNRYHLSGECGDLSCEYHHSDIDDVSLKVMRYIMLQYPCPRGPRCDNDKCYLGHFCQRPGCTGQKPCRFNSYAHRDDGETDELDIAWVL